MTTTIITKNSSTASAVPTTSDLVQGELAVNVTDKRLFTENASSTIVELGTNPSSITTGAITATGTVTANSNLSSSNAVLTGGTVNGIVIGGTTPSAITGTNITANTGFSGPLTGNVTGNLTGNVTGNITGDLTGNVTASSGTTTLNNLVLNGTVDFNTAVLTDLGAPVASTDAATKGYVDTQVSNLVGGAPAALDTLNELAAALNDDAAFNTTITNSIATKLPLAGGTMTGAIAMGTNKITGLGTPTAGTDAANKTYADTKLSLSGGTMTGNIVLGSNSATSTATPTTDDELTRKGYVDSILGSATSAATSAAAAATSASNAATSESNASTSASNAATSASNAAASYDSFDDRYLGTKTSDPTLDNDGDALVTGALYFNTTSNDMKVYNGSAWQVTSITTTNPTFTGTVTADGLSLGDSEKATFGASNDLEIYHDGSHSRIDDTGTGNLIIRANAATSIQKYTGEVIGQFTADGSVDLYYDNAVKFATTSTGIDVTGTVTADTLTVDNGIVSISNADANVMSSTGSLKFDIDSDNNNTDKDFTITHDGATKTLFNVDESGDISFYEDTGTTAKFFWDASAESLGIGTSSPNAPLSIEEVNTSVYSTTSISPFSVQVRNDSATTGSIAGIRLVAENSSGSAGSWVIGSLSTSTIYENDLIFQTRSGVSSYAERMRIDSSGNVGIGTTSPAKTLDVAGIIRSSSQFQGNPSSSASSPAYTFDGDSNNGIFRAGADSLGFTTSGTERMRIGSSGDLLVAKTVSDTSTAGLRVSGTSAGFVALVRDSARPLYIRRNTTDGDIVEFAKDGTTVGAIGSRSNKLYIHSPDGTNGAGLRLSDGYIIPCESDGSSSHADTDLGLSNSRFKDLYLSGTAKVGAVTYTGTDGTSGQVLTTDGSGNATFADAGGGGGAWEYLSTVTASSATEVDVEWTYGSHEAYMIIVNDYTPSANGALYAYLKLNSAYRSSGYNFHLMRPNSSSGSYSSVTGTNDSSIRVFDQATSNSNYPASLKFIVWNANQNTQYTTYNWIGNGLYYDNITPSDSLLYNYVGAGIQMGDYGISGVRFDRGSGDQSGAFFLYGLKTS